MNARDELCAISSPLHAISGIGFEPRSSHGAAGIGIVSSYAVVSLYHVGRKCFVLFSRLFAKVITMRHASKNSSEPLLVRVEFRFFDLQKSKLLAKKSVCQHRDAGFSVLQSI
jgi:hypothetical protein